MKYKVVVEYEYPVEHKTPVKAELILHGDRVETWNVKPLEQEPTTKNDLGVDCVSRENVLKLIYDYKENHSNDREHYPINYGTLLDMIRWVRDLPSVTPQPRKGHWIDTNDDGFLYHRIYKCSNCGATVCEYPENIKKYKYCPNCGAKMDEPQESEDKE